jgi:cytochrome c553
MNWMRTISAVACICAAAPAIGETMAEKLPLCLACHGEKGTSETPEIPSLGGQPASYVLIQLYQFREKQRIAEPMNELTKDFTDDDLRTYSVELAKLPPHKPPPDADLAKFEQGRAAAQKYRCGFCHNPDLSGHDQIGRIGDQREDYLLKALRGYKSGERKGYDPAMNEVAQEISDENIVARAVRRAFQMKAARAAAA